MGRYQSRAASCMVLVAFFIGTAVPRSAELPQAPSGDSDGARVARAFEFVAIGMRQARAKLLSGVCRFSGRLVQEFPDDPQRTLGKVRFDLKRPDFTVDRGSVRSAAQSGRVVGKTARGIATRRFADDRVRTTFWHSDNDVATIVQSKDVTSRRHAEYLDVWGITLYSQLAIERQYTFEQLVEQLVEFGKRPGAAVTGQDGPTWTLSWSAPGDGVWQTRWTLSVDTQRGFTPRVYRCESHLTAEGRKLLSEKLAQGPPGGAALRGVQAILQADAAKPFLEEEHV